MELEHAVLVEVQKAFEYVCLEANSRELYGALADGIGRCIFKPILHGIINMA